MSNLKPLTLYGSGGPNPPKVAILLEELNLPYTIEATPYSAIKSEPYLSINPNGRLPSLHDPNTDLTLWESGAIIQYLITHYDTAHKISFAPDTPETHKTNQWLFFQVSGQGPYYGQAVWFKKFHPEPIPGAVERYVKEINRHTAVLEGWLAQQKKDAAGVEGGVSNGTSDDGPWLVGSKCTYADLSFIPWQKIVAHLLSKDEYDEDKYPHVKDWMDRMCARESVKTVRAKSQPSF